MQIKNSAETFGLVTRLLHWIIGLVIIFLIGLGWYMVGLTYYDKWYNSSLTWHKSLGLIVLGLALFKLGWQVYSPLPAAGAGLKPWEKTASRIMHGILLTVMVLIPFTGYLISSSDGKAVAVFDWFKIPALVGKNTEIRDLAITVHFYLAYGTAVLVAGHIGAALKHQFIDKDSTLTRMLWK